MYYADDTWADGRGAVGDEVFCNDEEAENGDWHETWYRTQDRTLPKCIDQFVMNWLVENSKTKGWDAGIIQALEIIIPQ